MHGSNPPSPTKNMYKYTIMGIKLYTIQPLYIHSETPKALIIINIKMTTVASLLSENPVVVFSKTTCFISHSIVELIRKFGANPMIYELDELPSGSRIERELIEFGCNPSVPAVFIGKKLIGGANELISLNLQSKLRPLLINANAIWM
ncbi:putative thioredoxin-disulfide reductase [Helianthus annuus]|nr:putative thioredoxin-disulfide reductase [Helianthus annuus]